MSSDITHETGTTRPYWGLGCGVLVCVDEQMNVKMRDDPYHSANYGLLCSKGVALAETT